MITCILQVCDQQQEVRVDLLLNQIPEPTLAAELVVNTKGEAKKGQHTAYQYIAYFNKHQKAVADNSA